MVYLCCVGWLELKEMIASVEVGFLYMDVVIFVGVLCRDMSR